MFCNTTRMYSWHCSSSCVCSFVSASLVHYDYHWAYKKERSIKYDRDFHNATEIHFQRDTSCWYTVTFLLLSNFYGFRCTTKNTILFLHGHLRFAFQDTDLIIIIILLKPRTVERFARNPVVRLLLDQQVLQFFWLF